MSPWAAPRRRAVTLRERYEFAAEILTLYLALVEVWEEAWEAARAEQPPELAEWAARRVFPQVVAAVSLPEITELEAAEELLKAWLAGEELVPVERFLARATLRGPLAALDAGVECAGDPSPRGDRRCPRCGGPPQLSFRSETGSELVSGQRKLQCARCGDSWNFSSSSCAYCGEISQMTVYTEQRDGPQVGRAAAGDALFPHVRVEACATCERYLIDVDLGREPLAVPEVDELAALPLGLYAAERGLSKITPNVMGV
jgi:hypothetical protein